MMTMIINAATRITKRKNNNNWHKHFLERSDDYRSLHDELAKESAIDQREMKSLKESIRETTKPLVCKRNERAVKLKVHQNRLSLGEKELRHNLFDQYRLLNFKGDEVETPTELFNDHKITLISQDVTGDCPSIKLFQHAFQQMQKLMMMKKEKKRKREHRQRRQQMLLLNTSSNNTNNPMMMMMMMSSPSLELLSKHDKGNDNSNSNLLLRSLPPLDIFYEDEYLIVVNKRHDVLSVPGPTIEASIKTQLREKMMKIKMKTTTTTTMNDHNDDDDDCQHYYKGSSLIHSLDYLTSGLLLAAKDAKMHKYLFAISIHSKNDQVTVRGVVGR